MTLERTVSVTTFTADNQVTTSVDAQTVIDTERGYGTIPSTHKSPTNGTSGFNFKKRESTSVRSVGLPRPLDKKTASEQTFLTCSSNTAFSKAAWPSEDFDFRHLSGGSHSPLKNGHLKTPTSAKVDRCLNDNINNNNSSNQQSYSAPPKGRHYKKRPEKRRSFASCSNGEDVALDFHSVPAVSCRSLGEATSATRQSADTKSLPYESKTAPLPLDSPRATQNCAFSFLFRRRTRKSRSQHRESPSANRYRNNNNNHHHHYHNSDGDRVGEPRSRASAKPRVDSVSSSSFRLPRSTDEDRRWTNSSSSGNNGQSRDRTQGSSSRPRCNSKDHGDNGRSSSHTPAKVTTTTTTTPKDKTAVDATNQRLQQERSHQQRSHQSRSQPDRERDRDRDRDLGKDRERERDRGKDKERERDRGNDKERERDQDKDREKDRDRVRNRDRRVQYPQQIPVPRDRSEDAFYRNPRLENGGCGGVGRDSSFSSSDNHKQEHSERRSRSKSADSHIREGPRSTRAGSGSQELIRNQNCSRYKSQHSEGRSDPDDEYNNNHRSNCDSSSHGRSIPSSRATTRSRSGSVHGSLSGLGIYNPHLDSQVINDTEDYEYRPSDMRGPLNLSFCGCGFLGMYHLGVATCLVQKGPRFLNSIDKVGGASAGALMAAVLVTCPEKMEESGILIQKLSKEIRSKPLGALTPGYSLVKSMRTMLDTILPEGAHVEAKGRLYVSLTNVSTKKNEMMTDFKSREEFIDALVASSHIPVYAGMKCPTVRGKKYMDGGLSDNMPRFDKGRTITVSPFDGKSDIGPKVGHEADKKAHFINLHNQELQVSMNNFRRGAHAFFPPRRHVLDEYFEKGRYDASRFLVKEGLYDINVPASVSKVVYESSV